MQHSIKPGLKTIRITGTNYKERRQENKIDHNIQPKESTYESYPKQIHQLVRQNKGRHLCKGFTNCVQKGKEFKTTSSQRKITQSTEITRLFNHLQQTMKNLLYNGHRNTVTSINGTSNKTQGKFTCQSRYIVYVMTCTICKKQYVGETTQTLNKRFRLHKSFIRNNMENNIAEHFNLENHTETSYTVKIIGQEEDKNKRL